MRKARGWEETASKKFSSGESQQELAVSPVPPHPKMRMFRKSSGLKRVLKMEALKATGLAALTRISAHRERRGEEEEVESMEKNPLEAEVRLIKMLFQSISAENHS